MSHPLMQLGLNPAMRDTLAARLKWARTELRNMTQVELVKASGVAQSVISKVEQGLMHKPSGLPDLARALNIDVFWLKTGEGEPQPNSQRNVIPVTSRGRVPLISWVAAGNLGEVQDMYAPGEADEWIDTETQPGQSAFALKVTGDSMTSPYPGEVSFPDGSIIIVDPGRSASAGDFVVAKDVNTQQATFKKLAHDGGRWFLKPLNPTYPTVEIDDPGLRVIGRVIESVTRRKL